MPDMKCPTCKTVIKPTWAILGEGKCPYCDTVLRLLPVEPTRPLAYVTLYSVSHTGGRSDVVNGLEFIH